MTNRENPVWQMAYTVEFAHQLRDHLRLYIWPDDALLVELGDEAKTVADAAVEALGEPEAQPECTGLTAVWCPRCGDCTCDCNPSGERDLCTSSCKLHGTPQVSRHAEPERASLAKPQSNNEQPRDESRDIALNRSDVRAVLRRETTQCGALVPFRVDFRDRDNWVRYVPCSQLESARRDSELLDAILEAHGEPDDVARAIKNAIAERAKR